MIKEWRVSRQSFTRSFQQQLYKESGAFHSYIWRALFKTKTDPRTEPSFQNYIEWSLTTSLKLMIWNMGLASSNVCWCDWITEIRVMQWLTWGPWEGQESNLYEHLASQDHNPPHYQSPRSWKFFSGRFSVLISNFTEFYENQTPNSIKTPTHDLRTAGQASISLRYWISLILGVSFRFQNLNTLNWIKIQTHDLNISNLGFTCWANKMQQPKSLSEVFTPSSEQ